MEMKSVSHKTRETKQWDRRQSQPQIASKELETTESVKQNMISAEYSFRPTAPIVGRHEKGNSLVGFDPLLQDTNNINKIHNPFSIMAIVDTDAPSAKESRGEFEGNTINRQANDEELRTELRAIATELGKTSPKRSSTKSPTPIQMRKQETRKHETCPPTPLKVSSPVHRVHLPWQKKKQGHHRKARSLDSLDDTFKVAKNLESQKGQEKGKEKDIAGDDNKTKPTATSSMKHLLTCSSSMIQDLWELQRQAGTDSGTSAHCPLNKPRPTSFLTGKEIVLTSELDATDWQLSIPSKSEFEFTFKASQFLDTYRTEECLLDLNSLVGCSRLDLCELATGNSLGSKVKIAKFHQPIVESLLECGDDILMVRGYFKSNAIDGNPDIFREVLVLERQHQFLCVFRGTTAEQLGKVDRQPVAVKLMDNGGVSVFKDRYKSVQEFEPALFALLDKLMEESPFCDFCFAGHAFGAAMATLAAYRYAWARSELRVSAVVSGSAKVGLADFRLSAHSLSNLKVVRVELGYARPTANAGFHIGHTVRIHATRHPARQTVRAYKFADCKQDPSVIHKLRFVKGKTSAAYVRALEDLGNVWAKDFYRQDGAGVRGQNNEEREMV